MNMPLFVDDCDSGIYSKATGHPQYVPRTSEVIGPDTTYDLTKYKELRKEIAEADIPEDVKTFLNYAATRHIVFDYERVADYYAQAPKEVQELMEKSGLVIIDFEDAIENGFVELTDTLKNLYYEQVAKREEEKKNA